VEFWKSLLKREERLEKFLKSIPAIIFILELIGLPIVYLFDLTMRPEAWFYLFSTIPQAFAALVALVAVFLIPRLQNSDKYLNKESAKDLMKTSLKFSIIVIVLSFILIPFGSSIKDDWMLNIWDKYKLKWSFVFLVVGFCIGSLFKIYFALMVFLGEKEPKIGTPPPELSVSASPNAVDKAIKASHEIDEAKLKRLLR
jgi:hypothetical protein